MKVFISYAREDVDFVDRLRGSLLRRGFEPLVDRNNIQALDEWKKQLGRLIRRADAAIFVLSPAWLASEMCAWELQRANRLGKRLAPIVKEEPGAKVASTLSALQYIFFTDPNTLDEQADALCNALQSDAAWSGAHTRYLDLAERWEELRRPDHHCLKGKELKDAAQWLRKRPAVGAAPTELQKQFIRRSKFVNGWLYKTAQIIMTSIAASSNRLAEQIGTLLAAVLKYLFRFLLYLVAAPFRAAGYLFAWTVRHWKWAPGTLALMVAAFLIILHLLA
jgi:TIR domain